MMQALLTPLARPAAARGELTAREAEVLALVADGLESKQIARDLHLSPDTVRTHVANVLTKVHARTRAQAVAIAIRRGWID